MQISGLRGKQSFAGWSVLIEASVACDSARRLTLLPEAQFNGAKQ